MYIYNYIVNDDVKKTSKRENTAFSLEQQSAIIINSDRTLKDKLSGLRTLKNECSVNLAYQIEAWENYKKDVIKQASTLGDGCVFCLLVDGEPEKFFANLRTAEKYIKEYAAKNEQVNSFTLVSEKVLSATSEISLEKDNNYNKLIYNGKGELLDAVCKTDNHTYLTAVYGKRLDTVYVPFPNPFKDMDVVWCGQDQAIIAPETQENKAKIEHLITKYVGKKGYNERYVPVYLLNKTKDGYHQATIGALPLLSLRKTAKDEISAKSRFTLKQLRKLKGN